MPRSRIPEQPAGPGSKRARGITSLTPTSDDAMVMPKAKAHRWEFVRRFRRGGFGWKSQPAIQRVREAVSEIRKVARRDPMLAAEGAVRFLERVSPALEHVDSSSGAIGTAVNHAIAELVDVIAGAPAPATTREAWLERLWEAHARDEIPYIERLGDFWGELCASRETASAWGDRLVGIVEMAWSPDPERRGFFHGTTACLSALFHAGRHEGLLALLEKDRISFWPYRQWGVRALAALGRTDDAIRYAEASRGRNDSPVAIARVCEEILLASGRVEEAYRDYGLEASRGTSYLATYRTLARKYPGKSPDALLQDLVATTPGDEGKWFATAKDLGLFDEAIRLANLTPCDPRTLARAARDLADARPAFALEVGVAALRWLVEGYGYEITGADVWGAYANTMKAAEKAGRVGEVREQIRRLVAGETFGERFVTRILGRELRL